MMCDRGYSPLLAPSAPSNCWGGTHHKIILINQQMVEVTVETEQSHKLTFILLSAPCSPNEELLLAGRLGYNW